MKYLLVHWIHEHENEPVILISELIDDGSEVRKIEIFKNGSIGWADKNISKGPTRLGIEPIPPIETIEKDAQFRPKWITQQEFEKEWMNRGG